MAKTKVILADLDEAYLSPIEIKFLEEMDDDIELELITKAEFFNEYFSKPRNVDILLVSEKLYSEELRRHNITNIFVLAEQPDKSETKRNGVTRLFKYTSIKEIYNQVIATSAALTEKGAVTVKETKVILFCSASGGTGKTSLSLGLSGYLAKNYKKVLYIDAEGINSFQHMLNNQTAISGNAYQEFINIGADIYTRVRHYIRNEEFDYLPPFGMAISSLNIDYSMYRELISAVKLSKEYDVIVVDTDSIFNEQKSNLIMLADKVVMVLNQTKASVFAMNMLLKNMSSNDSEKFCFVCNNYHDQKPNAIVSGMTTSFYVSEYISHIETMEMESLRQLAVRPEIQKLAILVE